MKPTNRSEMLGWIANEIHYRGLDSEKFVDWPKSVTETPNYILVEPEFAYEKNEETGECLFTKAECSFRWLKTESTATLEKYFIDLFKEINDSVVTIRKVRR